MLRTSAGIIFRPGATAAKWIAGKRTSLAAPFSFVLLVGLTVALIYEPLQAWRSSRLEPGHAVYAASLAQNATRYFAFYCMALALPISGIVAWIGSRFQLERTWIEWYVLGLYCYGIASVVQISIEGLAAWFTPRGIGLHLSIVETILPMAWFAWGAWGFVPKSKRGFAFILAFGTQILILLVLLVLVRILGG